MSPSHPTALPSGTFGLKGKVKCELDVSWQVVFPLAPPSFPLILNSGPDVGKETSVSAKVGLMFRGCMGFA
jgi:hypothetical protein